MTTRSRVLMTAVLTVVGALLAAPELPAQKKEKDDRKWEFEIEQDRSKQYRWHLRRGDGFPSANSGDTRYKTAAEAKKAIETLRAGITDKMRVEYYIFRDGSHGWRLKADGRLVATSAGTSLTQAIAAEQYERFKKGVRSAVIKDAR